MSRGGAAAWRRGVLLRSGHPRKGGVTCEMNLLAQHQRRQAPTIHLASPWRPLTPSLAAARLR
jgi:hypothetical protein